MEYVEDQIIVFEKGDYGDRHYTGAFICLATFNLKEELDKWCIDNTIDHSYENDICIIVKGIPFVDYLVLQGYLKSIKIDIINQDTLNATNLKEYSISKYIESSKVLKPWEYK